MRCKNFDPIAASVAPSCCVCSHKGACSPESIMQTMTDEQAAAVVLLLKAPAQEHAAIIDEMPTELLELIVTLLSAEARRREMEVLA